jgi:hypothetical protein
VTGSTVRLALPRESTKVAVFATSSQAARIIVVMMFVWRQGV